MRVGDIQFKLAIAADSMINGTVRPGGSAQGGEALPTEEFGGKLYNFRGTVCATQYCRKQPFGGTYYLNTSNKLIYG